MVYANIIGSIVNDVLPSGVILSLLMILLFVGLLINIYNAINKFKEETKKIKENELKKQNGSENLPLKNKEEDSSKEKVDHTGMNKKVTIFSQ